jgi:pimeloyl-[acyl-carrier protein] methyl ester esterase
VDARVLLLTDPCDDRRVTVDASRPLPVLLLPGLDGSGQLFKRFQAVATGSLDFRTVPYPRDRFLDYAALETLVRGRFPRGPFAILGESFGGPLALRVAASAPRGLVGVILAATFHRQPARPVIARATVLAPAFFRLPLPPHVVRLLLAGGDASQELVEEVREAVRLVPARVMAARAREALAVDASEPLRRCPVPVLFLGGKHDRLLRREIPDEVRALQPGAEIRMLDTPHLVLQRRPEEAMQIVEEFLLERGGPPLAERPSGASRSVEA